MDTIRDIIDNAPEFSSGDKPGPQSQSQPASAFSLPLRLKIGSDVDIANAIARDFKARLGEVIFDEGGFWYFSGKHWVQIEPESELRRAVHRYDGAKYPGSDDSLLVVRLNKSRVNSVIHELGALLFRKGFFDTQAFGINCGSGFITFDSAGTPSLVPHSPDHRRRHVLPGSWPAAPSADRTSEPMIRKLLDGCFRDEVDAASKINLIGELAGAAAIGLNTRLKKPKAIIFKGETAENGKSQILDLLRGLLPPSAVSSIPPHKFHDEKFIVGLVSKQLNCSDELTSAAAVGSDVFKSVVTGEPISARDVFRSMVVFRPQALNVFATNDLPAFRGGMDRGVIRRLVVIPFRRVIPEGERVENIGQRIAKEEADLLLDFAVEGASRLIPRGQFEVPESCQTALNDWCLAADPIQGWLETVETGKHFPPVRTRDAYATFKSWAITEGYREDTLPKVHNFAQRIFAHKPEITKGKTHGFPTLKGIRIPNQDLPLRGFQSIDLDDL